MKVKRINEWMNDWWNTDGKDLLDLLSNLSGDKTFHEKLHTTDLINVYNFAKSCEIPIDNDSENFLLKEICGELAEQALATKYGVSPDELFDEDGNFYEQYQGKFNRFYDQIEEQIMCLESINQMKSNAIIPCSRMLYGIFSFTDVFKFLAKVIPCPHCPARSTPFGFSKKSPRLRFASGSIFPKKPCMTGHGINCRQKF